MNFIKPKYNIGDKVYYIYYEIDYKNIYCEYCNCTHTKQVKSWIVNEQEKYICVIDSDFNENTLVYNLAEYEDDHYYFTKWDMNCNYNIEENCIFISLEDARNECEKRNNKRKEG